MTREEHAPGRAVGHLAAEVVRAASAAAEAMPRTADGPPAVGDLYVLDATAEHDVEWLLAAEDPARPGVFRAVAADTAPWVGGGDVELPEDEPLAPMAARCRHWLWLGAEDLAAGRVTGRVGHEVAARVEQRCHRVEEDRLDPSPLERETDADPDYRDRDRELADAVGELARRRRGAHAGESPPTGRGSPTPFSAPGSGDPSEEDRDHRPPRRNSPWQTTPQGGTPWTAVAAAVLLIALLAWFGWVLARQDLRIAELRQRLDEASRPVVAVNEPFVIDNITRSAPVLEPSVGGGQFHLQLAWTKVPRARYRIVVTALDGGEPVLDFGELTVDETPTQATLRWGQDLLAPGLYELRLLDPTRDPPGLFRAVPLRIPATVGTEVGSDGDGGGGGG